MEERLRFAAKLLDGESMTDVCREFGISRKTVVDAAIGHLLPIHNYFVEAFHHRAYKYIRGRDVLVPVSAVCRLQIPAARAHGCSVITSRASGTSSRVVPRSLCQSASTHRP